MPELAWGISIEFYFYNMRISPLFRRFLDLELNQNPESSYRGLNR